MQLAMPGRRFGSQVNASQVQFAPWGTLTMTYSGGC
jgi:hypothetical protein